MQNYGILWGDFYHRFLHKKSTQVKDEEPLKTKRSVCGLNSWDLVGFNIERMLLKPEKGDKEQISS
jgi:hypothetical protein